MRKNTFVSIVLEIALVMGVLLGCGSENPESFSGAVAEEIEESPQIETIRVATWYDDSYTPNLRAYLTKHFPEYKFEFTYIEKNHYKTIIDTQLSFNNAPDIIYVDQLMATNLAENGHIIPLTQICGNFTVDGLTAFWYDRDTYAVPSTSSYECMYVNKSLFDKHGLKVPENPQEYIEMCDYIRKNESIKPLSAGMMDYETVSRSALAILQANYFETEYGRAFGTRLKFGKSIFFKDLYEPLLDWENMVQQEIFTPEMFLMDKQAAIAEFVAEKSFMLVGGPEDYNRIRVANPKIELGTLPLGWGKNGGILIGGCDGGFAVNAKSENIENAKEVVKALASKEGQFEIWKDRVGSTTYLRKTQFDNPAAFDGIKDVLYINQVYLPVKEWGDLGPEMNMIFGKELQQVLIGKEPLNMALMKIDIKVNNLKNE